MGPLAALLQAGLVAAAAPAPAAEAQEVPDEVQAAIEAETAPEPGADRERDPWIWGPDFSPNVNLYGNFLARKERKPIRTPDGEEVSDIARIRQIDLIVDTPIAPRMTAFIAASAQSNLVNSEFSLEFEQAYVLFEALPVIGDLPRGLSLLVGNYRTNFGRMNRERIYDVPHINRPRSQTNFFGDNGYSATGLSISYALPISDYGALKATADYLDSGDPPLAIDEGGNTGATNFRAAWIPAPNATHRLEIGASRIHSRRADEDGRRAKVTGYDALYSWKPDPDRPPAVWFGGEWMRGAIDNVAFEHQTPRGYYLWTQVRITDRWFVGVRYDVADELEFDDLRTHTQGIYLTYATNALARLAIGAERSQSDVDLLDDVTRVFVEFNFGAGTNPHVPFWLR